MTKPNFTLLATFCFPLIACSLTACQPGGVEEEDSATSADVKQRKPQGTSVCGDPAGCVTVNTPSLSYYTGPNCTGTEYALSSFKQYNSWDGYGLLGKTTVLVSIVSARTLTGACETASSQSNFQRVYREVPAASCSACGLCQTCVAGKCVAVGTGSTCAPSVCTSSTSTTSYVCSSGACEPIVESSQACIGDGVCGELEDCSNSPDCTCNGSCIVGADNDARNYICAGDGVCDNEDCHYSPTDCPCPTGTTCKYAGGGYFDIWRCL